VHVTRHDFYQSHVRISRWGTGGAAAAAAVVIKQTSSRRTAVKSSRNF